MFSRGIVSGDASKLPCDKIESWRDWLRYQQACELSQLSPPLPFFLALSLSILRWSCRWYSYSSIHGLPFALAHSHPIFISDFCSGTCTDHVSKALVLRTYIKHLVTGIIISSIFSGLLETEECNSATMMEGRFSSDYAFTFLVLSINNSSFGRQMLSMLIVSFILNSERRIQEMKREPSWDGANNPHQIPSLVIKFILLLMQLRMCIFFIHADLFRMGKKQQLLAWISAFIQTRIAAFLIVNMEHFWTEKDVLSIALWK